MFKISPLVIVLVLSHTTLVFGAKYQKTFSSETFGKVYYYDASVERSFNTSLEYCNSLGGAVIVQIKSLDEWSYIRSNGVMSDINLGVQPSSKSVPSQFSDGSSTDHIVYNFPEGEYGYKGSDCTVIVADVQQDRWWTQSCDYTRAATLCEKAIVDDASVATESESIDIRAKFLQEMTMSRQRLVEKDREINLLKAKISSIRNQLQNVFKYFDY